MIEVTLKIRDVDYAAAAGTLLPVLLERLSGSASPLTALLLEKTKGLPSAAVKAALEVLPKETKDELAAACLNHYSAEISQAIENFAVKKALRLCVEGVQVTITD